jgi:hypothetical protein
VWCIAGPDWADDSESVPSRVRSAPGPGMLLGPSPGPGWMVPASRPERYADTSLQVVYLV